jgi:hypothetical protein
MFAHAPEFGEGEVADDLAFAAEFVPAGHRRVFRTVLVSVNILFGSPGKVRRETAKPVGASPRMF